MQRPEPIGWWSMSDLERLEKQHGDLTKEIAAVDDELGKAKAEIASLEEKSRKSLAGVALGKLKGAATKQARLALLIICALSWSLVRPMKMGRLAKGSNMKKSTTADATKPSNMMWGTVHRDLTVFEAYQWRDGSMEEN